MLQVDLRELVRGPVDTAGVLAPDDPLFAGLDVALAQPVRVAGRLQATGEDRYYWSGTLQTTIQAACRRCLKDFVLPVTASVGALFSQESDVDDDPDAYPLPGDAVVVDVTPAVREELMLAVPRYALCRPDCRGLCPRCGQDWNAGSCDCATATDARWAALAALKPKPGD
jgi:uncharacterized protein